ncbi:MAG: phosphoribosyl-ATP diphosphatase [Alphaproteobacteria bacterium]
MAVLARLAATIGARRGAAPAASYTAQLLAEPDLAVRKFGEEALEVVMAAMQPDAQSLASEAADVIYHLLVLCEAHGVGFAQVLGELQRREGVSGLAEKAARGSGAPKKNP